MTLIGRERTLAAARDLLASPDTRVLTLCGPAGSGTSAVLAALVGSAGAWSIDLADADGETTLWAQVAGSLGIGIGFDGDADAEARLAEVVSARPVTLAIDHADAAPLRAADLDRLLERCPTLTLMIASVSALAARGEHVVRVDPLPVPAPSAGYEAISASPSVRLFVERALEVDAGFRLDPETAADVARVCRLVGGLPLGIELAAARVRLLSPHELAARLKVDGSDPDLLGSGVSEHAGRWPSLRAALDSTTSFLTETQRTLFRRAAMFDGPFTVDAVQVVDHRSLGEVLDDLGALVDARLIEPLPVAADQEPLFEFLPIVCTYAREAESPDEVAATARREYICTIAQAAAEASADCRTSPDIERVRTLRRDVVSVLAELVDADHLAAARLAVDAASALMGLPERAAIGAALDGFIATGAVDSFTPELAERVWLCSAEVLAESPDAEGQGATISARWQRGRALVDDAARPLQGLTCRQLAVMSAPATGDAALAVAAMAEGRALASAIGHPAWLARFEAWSAAMAYGQGQVDGVADLAFTALRRATRVGDAKAIASAAMLLQLLPPSWIDPRIPVPPMESVLALSRASGDVFAESFALAALVSRELDAGRPVSAAVWCRERLEWTARLGWTSTAGISVLHVAFIAEAFGDEAFAAFLVGAMSTDETRILRSVTPRRSAAYAELLPRLRSDLGEHRYSALVAEGSALPAKGAASAALSWLERNASSMPPVAAPSSATPAMSSDGVTPRELEVLGLLANGLSNREIAQELLLSVKTVMHHSMAIYRKLDVRGRAEATAYAHRHGLVAQR